MNFLGPKNLEKIYPLWTRKYHLTKKTRALKIFKLIICFHSRYENKWSLNIRQRKMTQPLFHSLTYWHNCKRWFNRRANGLTINSYFEEHSKCLVNVRCYFLQKLLNFWECQLIKTHPLKNILNSRGIFCSWNLDSRGFGKICRYGA